jgi:hypothetical protein
MGKVPTQIKRMFFSAIDAEKNDLPPNAAASVHLGD